jgi:hypothetical protein
VLKSAEALKELHTQGIAHRDIRTFNLAFMESKPGARKSDSVFNVVFIDLDRGTERLYDLVGSSDESAAQTLKPDSWPEAVPFNAKRCDWRQWALMIWSVLVESAEEVDMIYSAKKDVSGSEFLNDILSGRVSDWDDISVEALNTRLLSWLRSRAFKEFKSSCPSFNTSTLSAEV